MAADNLDLWDVLALRLTVFAQGPVDARPELWTRFTGSVPEAEEIRELDGLKKFSGKYLGGDLILSIARSRLDLVLQPPTGVLPGQMPSFFVGKFGKTFTEFRMRVPEFLAQLGLVSRIAVAGTVLQEVSSALDTYKQMQGLLKSVKFDATKVGDLGFKVNWRIPSTINKSIIINRLTHWSGVELRTVQISNAPDQSMVSKYYVQLEFDINNVPSSNIYFETGDARELAFELMTRAEENVRVGEVVSHAGI